MGMKLGSERWLKRTLVTAATLALLTSGLTAVTLSVPQTAGATTNPHAIVTGFNSTSYGPNDDGSWPCTGSGSGKPSGCTPQPLALPFSVDFFGTTYTNLYLNNNGNLTFGAYLTIFTPYPLSKQGGTPIIAPFFADVTTRVGNTVTFGKGTVGGHKAFGVNWPGVGCFSENTSVLDNFQVLLIDRTDVAPGDFDVEFNYDQIQ